MDKSNGVSPNWGALRREVPRHCCIPVETSQVGLAGAAGIAWPPGANASGSLGFVGGYGRSWNGCGIEVAWMDRVSGRGGGCGVSPTSDRVGLPEECGEMVVSEGWG